MQREGRWLTWHQKPAVSEVSPAGFLQLALAWLRSASYTQPPLQEAIYMVQLYHGVKGMLL